MINGVNKTVEWLARFQRDCLTIECGDWSYGSPTLHLSPHDQPRRLEIGRYCSIAVETSIHLGIHGQHSLDTITSYPLSMVISDNAKSGGDIAISLPKVPSRPPRNVAPNLDVFIGHDVWIGHRATILAGVSIGTGAVIATGAVVTESVLPYEIVGGVPAKHIRFRHDPEIISQLLTSEWWNLEPDDLWRACGTSLYSPEVAETLELIGNYRRQQFSAKPSGLAELQANLVNAREVLGGLDASALYDIFTSEEYAGRSLPKWPDIAVQKRYTGGSGSALMERAFRFVAALEDRGELRNDWKGLEFGVGWGRIASCLLRFGSPAQLDVCDAWESSLDLAREAGLKN